MTLSQAYFLENPHLPKNLYFEGTSTPGKFEPNLAERAWKGMSVQGSVTTGMFSMGIPIVWLPHWSTYVGSGRKPWTCHMDGLETLLHALCLEAGSPGPCPWGQSWLQGLAPGSP